MKNILKKSIAVIAIAVAFISCSKNEDAISGMGTLKIQYENGFAGNELVLGSPTVATSQGEVLKISTIKYIISNIVLYNENGDVYTYPKSQSYFIVDEQTPASLLISLPNVPAGNYNKIKFGIGVDQAQYNLGASGQGDFWTQAQASEMDWGWSAGYKFVRFEGTFTAPSATPSVTADTSFMVHTGQTSTDYNYREVTLPLPTSALVRTTISPQIHLSTDLSKIIDGTNKVSLAANNNMGMGAMIMGGTVLTQISDNIPSMFSVEHVHNDPN